MDKAKVHLQQLILRFLHFLKGAAVVWCLKSLTFDHKIAISEVRRFKVDRVVLFPYREENLIRDVSRQGSVSMGTSDK